VSRQDRGIVDISYLRVPFLIILLLLALVSSATAELSEGDKLFIGGAYDEATVFYGEKYRATSEPAEKRRLLLKLLGVAQARNDLATMWTLGDLLEDALEGQDDPEVAMRLHLIRGVTSMRTFDAQTAADSFAKARPLAQSLYEKGDPGGALGLAECNSYDYLGPMFVVGRPEPKAYEEACLAAYQPCFQVPATREKPLWLMDVTRTVVWTRMWIWKAWEFYYTAYTAGEQELADRWAATSGGIGYEVIQAWSQSLQSTQNLELVAGITHIMLEMTESFPVAPWAPTLLAQAEAYIGQWPPTLEKHHMQGRFYRAKARRAVAEKKYEQALDDYQRSVQYMESSKRALDLMDVMVELGYVHLLEGATGPRWEREAKKTLEGLLPMAEEVRYPLARYYALGFLGTMRAREEEWAEAEGLLKQALQQLKEFSQNETPQARAQKLARREVRLFSDTLVDVLLRQDKKTEAMESVGQIGAISETAGLDLERVKAKNPETSRNLRSLEESRRQRGKLLVKLQSAQVAGDKASADLLSSRLADNKADFQKTVNTIRRDDPEFERMVSVRPSSFAKIQQFLPPDVVLAAYYPSAERTLVFAVTRDQSHVYASQVGRAELDSFIGQARRGLVSGKQDSAPLSKLHQVLISPIEPLLKEKKMLVVVPSGKLYYLPFPALLDQQGRPLIESVSVSFLTATELPDVAAFGSSSKPARLLALANPDGSLPGAQKEVDNIASLFTEKRVFYGKEATQDKVDGAEDVLHFATHGVLDTLDVNESYLLMSGDDERLTVGEIYGLDLGEVSLVTLSACQTAVGEFNPGAEIATLSQAFSIAGSKSMLGTLWKVDDRATAFLMERFYTYLTEGKTKAEALRLAQLETAKKPEFESPFYWSGFVLLGDWQ
jgi:CHAT domain-containing protein